MSKGSTRRPEDREAIEKNWPLDSKTWFCTDCGSKAVPGGPDGTWNVCPNPECPDRLGVFYRPGHPLMGEPFRAPTNP